MKDKNTRSRFRKERVRRKILKAANGLPRLAVRRSLKYIYAQVIDDGGGRTLVSATTLSKDVKGSAKNITAAKTLGRSIAEKALGAGIEKVVFDRGGRKYHGRIKAVAEAARSAGLKF